MKLLSLIFLASFVSCQDLNSNSNDAAKYTNVELTGSANFKTAYYVLRNRCANCHTSSIHSSWSSYTNEQDWIDKGYVSPSSPDNSTVVNRTINYGATYSDMPKGGTAIPTEEYTALRTWAAGIQ